MLNRILNTTDVSKIPYKGKILLFQAGKKYLLTKAQSGDKNAETDLKLLPPFISLFQIIPSKIIIEALEGFQNLALLNEEFLSVLEKEAELQKKEAESHTLLNFLYGGNVPLLQAQRKIHEAKKEFFDKFNPNPINSKDQAILVTMGLEFMGQLKLSKLFEPTKQKILAEYNSLLASIADNKKMALEKAAVFFHNLWQTLKDGKDHKWGSWDDGRKGKLAEEQDRIEFTKLFDKFNDRLMTQKELKSESKITLESAMLDLMKAKFSNPEFDFYKNLLRKTETLKDATDKLFAFSFKISQQLQMAKKKEITFFSSKNCETRLYQTCMQIIQNCTGVITSDGLLKSTDQLLIALHDMVITTDKEKPNFQSYFKALEIFRKNVSRLPEITTTQKSVESSAGNNSPILEYQS
jgi:hypothetical protein